MSRDPVKRLTNSFTPKNIDLATSLRDEKQRLLKQIDALFDPVIAAAERARAAQVPYRKAVPPGRAPKRVPVGYADMTAPTAVEEAIRQNGGAATIPEILRILGRSHPLNLRAKPGKAVSGVLGRLRARKIVEKTADKRFQIRATKKR
jgi:hypothetical protein